MKQIDLIKVLVLLDWNRLKMLNESDLERYSRQLIIPEIDEEGQLILLNSNILIIGAGGLGNPAAIFCTAAGIGSIDICDYDKIELSNLNRQIAYSVSDIGLPKSDVLKKYCLKLNSNLNINSFDIKFDENFSVSKYDIILDCSDNITTRYNANFLAHTNKKVLISGSATQFEGQLAVFKSGNDKNAPCYECVFPKNQHEETNLNCRESGIIGPITNLISSLQVTETIREIFIRNSIKKNDFFTKNSLFNNLLLYNGIEQEITKIKLIKNPNCIICK